MKNKIKELIRTVIVGCMLPAIMIGFVFFGTQKASGGEIASTTEGTSPPQIQQTQESQETVPTAPTQYMPAPVYIQVLNGDAYCQMELEAYILNVVLGEMPADFELEALKAQAVVARTYTLKVYWDNARHDGAVCTNSGCCQAYQTPQRYFERGGTEEGLQRVKQAVEETCGQVLTYEGKLINATYFSCSGGSTEDAAAVWGYDVPYLQAVESPGEEGASVYEKQVSFTAAEFQKILAVRLSGDPKTWFGKVRYTEGGGVESMDICGVTYRGTTLRSLLKLRSTIFTVKVEGDSIHFYTRGYGHRVGMSQYGADAMALAGSTYEQILTHYYQNTQLLFIEDV